MTINHDNSPHAYGILVSDHLTMYHLFRVCHTLVPVIHISPEMLCVFRYSGPAGPVLARALFDEVMNINIELLMAQQERTTLHVIIMCAWDLQVR